MVLRKRRFWLGLVVVLLLALVTLWAAGPWLAMRSIDQALAQRSPGLLEQHVDFPALRVSLKAQLADSLVRAAGPDVQANRWGALAVNAAGQLAGAGVDTVVTPGGVIALLHGQGVWRRATGQRSGADTYAPSAPPAPFQSVEWRYESPSRFSAVRRTAEGRQTTFVFQRQGLRWRLVDIRLSDPRALLDLLD